MAEYNHSVYRGLIIKGCLKEAMAYCDRFPQHQELLEKYEARFQQEKYLSYAVCPKLNQLLLAYQKYCRDVFYLEQVPEKADAALRQRLAGLLGLDESLSMEDLEEKEAAKAFAAEGFHFLGGKTSGYYGPYIWKTEELKRYAVQLPEGEQEYPVKFLDGFVFQGWMDYISFGIVRTGGWSNGDGLIHCVKPAYNLESESFQVSLLKHEAQHAADLARYPDMSNEDLEYRAKLVELVYSKERDLLTPFAQQAGDKNKANGHARAAARIAAGMERLLCRKREDFPALPHEEVMAAAGTLFAESCGEMAEKYGQEDAI